MEFHQVSFKGGLRAGCGPGAGTEGSGDFWVIQCESMHTRTLLYLSISSPPSEQKIKVSRGSLLHHLAAIKLRKDGLDRQGSL